MPKRRNDHREVLISLLSGGESFSIADAAMACECCKSQAQKMLRELHIKERKIYISGWRRENNGPYYPVFSFGRRKDAKKPEPISDQERWKRQRERNRLRMQRGYWAKKVAEGGIAAVDPLLAAIMGAPNAAR